MLRPNKPYIISRITVLIIVVTGLSQTAFSEGFKFRNKLSIIHKLARSLEEKQSPVFFLPAKAPKQDEVYFTVEIPAGSSHKYEMRTATGQIILDRVLCPRLAADGKTKVEAFPANYGFSAGRFNVDGDPLDMVVIGGDKKYAEQVRNNRIKPRRVRIVGVIRMEECGKVPCKTDEDWERDWKIVAVDLEDVNHRKATTMEDVPKTTLNALSTFFSNYKGPKKGHPQTRVDGYLDKKDALEFVSRFQVFDRSSRQQEVASCRAHNTRIIKNMGSTLQSKAPALDSTFLKCQARVFDARFFSDADTTAFYMKYSAYQILRKTKVSDLSLAGAIAKMESLRKKGKKYYRFVGFDKPHTGETWASKGSGNLILEWVKTKNRNKGCDPSFPKQHYESNDLIDL